MKNIKSKCAGFALLEVLIAVFVLSIGLLGVASLQSVALRNNTSAYMRTQAGVLTADIMDRMRANVMTARAGSYNRRMGDAKPTGTTQQDIDRINWLAALASVLPSGDGAINCTATLCSIAVRWNDESGLKGNQLQGVVDFDGDTTNDNDADADGTVDREIVVLVSRL